MNKINLAWLAGFWDGEGSVGLTKTGTTFILNCQLSHTDIESVKRILSILKSEGVGGRGYTYQERDPKRHRDAHYIRIGGIANVLKFARLMVPYAFTKKRHWELAIEWAESRILVAGGVDSRGHLFRGRSHTLRQYSKSDLKLAVELKSLNLRGPDDRKERKAKSGRIKS